ncbi:MAG: hypothetical protein ACK56I_26750, partial [bacterium]
RAPPLPTGSARLPLKRVLGPDRVPAALLPDLWQGIRVGRPGPVRVPAGGADHPDQHPHIGGAAPGAEGLRQRRLRGLQAPGLRRGQPDHPQRGPRGIGAHRGLEGLGPGAPRRIGGRQPRRRVEVRLKRAGRVGFGVPGAAGDLDGVARHSGPDPA